jgi:phosphoribosylformylglycinamidine synthase
MWQFAAATRGLADACQELGLPVTGGNVSFYNQTAGTPIDPTPIVGVLGVLDDVACRTPMGFRAAGDVVLLLGTTREELGGSEWAHVVHEHLGGRPPRVDLAAERRLAEILIAGARDQVLSSAHDLSDGGLAQALVEACLRGGLGVQVTLPGAAFVALFSESAARAIVTVPPGKEPRLLRMCDEQQFPVARLGVVGGPALEVRGQFSMFSVPLDELREAWSGTLPQLFS